MKCDSASILFYLKQYNHIILKVNIYNIGFRSDTALGLPLTANRRKTNSFSSHRIVFLDAEKEITPDFY
jgi:hypothetical protein